MVFILAQSTEEILHKLPLGIDYAYKADVLAIRSEVKYANKSPAHLIKKNISLIGRQIAIVPTT